MLSSRRSFNRPILFLFIFSTLFLAACGSRLENQNWPGLSTDGQKIYLANGPGVTAYNVDDQEIAWTYPAEANATLQYYSAPSVEGEKVVFGDYGASGGFFSPQIKVSIYGVENTDSGGTAPNLWPPNSELAHDKIVAPPLQVGNVAYVGTADKFLFAIDTNSGQELWSFETGQSIWGRPSYQEGVIFVASMDRSLHALNADTGEELWLTIFDGALASGPVLNDNLVYVSSFDSHVHAVDIKTGEIAWSAQGENWIWGAPAYADGTVYFADINGNVFAVDAQTGEKIWQNQTVGAVQTQPVVSGDIVYVASEGESSEIPLGALRAFSTADGTEIWTQAAPAPLFTTPVVVDDALIVALQSETAIVIAYDVQTGGQLWSISPPVES